MNENDSVETEGRSKAGKSAELSASPRYSVELALFNATGIKHKWAATGITHVCAPGTAHKCLKVIVTRGGFTMRANTLSKCPPKTGTRYLIIHPITLFISGGFSWMATVVLPCIYRCSQVILALHAKLLRRELMTLVGGWKCCFSLKCLSRQRSQLVRPHRLIIISLWLLYFRTVGAQLGSVLLCSHPSTSFYSLPIRLNV